MKRRNACYGKQGMVRGVRACVNCPAFRAYALRPWRHGARDDGEKVHEVLANYGVFRITYVGQSRLLETTVRRKIFNQRTIVIVVHRNGAKVWRGKSVIEFAEMHWGEARRARES